MGDNHKIKLSELRLVIRDALSEAYIEEKFGEKIGDQTATVGVADERNMDEVAPKGYEDVVKGIKKGKGVKNPWAVAWAMKKKGIKPKK